MKRRRLLSTATLAVAGVAGCTNLSDESSDSTTVQPPSMSELIPTSTPTADPAAFDLVSIDAAERVELGDDWTLSWTVRNTSERDGVVRTGISVRKAGDTWHSPDSQIELAVPAGETATWESKQRFNYLGQFEYRLDRFDATFGVQIVPKTLDWGRPHLFPNRIQVISIDIDIVDSFEWSRDGREYVKEAPSGKQFGLLTVRAENLSTQQAVAPRNSRFYLAHGETRYDPQITSIYPNQYQGGELQPGAVERGEIVFELDAGLTQADLVGLYSSELYAGEITVYWGRD